MTLVGWCATRALTVYLALGPIRWVQGDLRYFHHRLLRLAHVGWAHTLPEYPVPGVGVLGLPGAVSRSLHVGAYVPLFMAMIALCDAGFLILLRRCSGSWRSPGVLAWVVAVPLFGAATFARFDLVPGVLLGIAVLLVGPRPRLAAAAAAFATGIKLWPAVVLPTLAARRGTRRAVLTTTAACGAALVLVSVLLAGWSRLWSPLSWESARGLQIESVSATPLMVAWWLGVRGYAVAYTQHHAFEILGPGVHAALAVVDGLELGVLLLVGVLSWRAWRAGARLTPGAIAWLCLAAVSGLVVSGKVFSPQYLYWLLPAASAALVITTAATRRRLVAWVALLLIATELSQLVFPVLYVGLIARDASTGLAVVALGVRNAVMVALAGLAIWQAHRELAATGEDGGSDRVGAPSSPESTSLVTVSS